MNPLIGLVATQANNQNPTMRALAQFSKFRNNWTPEAAQQKVSEMLKTGQISPQQYEQAKQLAEQLRGLIR